MKWHDVFKKHRKISAVYTEGRVLKSLAFSLDRRRNRINEKKENSLYFFFNPSHRNNDIKALKNAIKTKIAIPVYYKSAPDNWQDIGAHIVEKYFNGKDSLGRESIVFVVSPFT